MKAIEAALIAGGGDVVHHFCGGVYAKETHIPKGTILGQHEHNHDHMSVLAAGSVELITRAGAMVYAAPAVIRIVAEVEHSVRALTDAVWFCIWPEDAEELKGD